MGSRQAGIGSHHPVRSVAAVAAAGALIALLVGGTLMALPVARGVPAAGWPVVLASLGPVALAAISLFDMFTVPALHLTLSRHGPALIIVATGCALIGDLLGVAGRLTQFAAVTSLVRGGPDAQFLLLDLLQGTVNTAGFCLVAVSFTCFGVLFLRAGSRTLGLAAMAAGLLTGMGQVPHLEPVFYAANLAFIAWYVGLVATFRRRARAK